MPLSLALRELNEKFKASGPEAILKWTIGAFPGRAAMTTSFQASGIVLLYFLKKIAPGVPVYFIDTGFHFPETIEFRNRLAKEWHLDVHTIIPAASKTNPEKECGGFLYERDPDRCCLIHKVVPLRNLQKEADMKAWISAIRKDQSHTRKAIEPLMLDPENRLHVHPLVHWTRERIWTFIERHGLPCHPLYDQGYTSIGCFPPSCTSKNGDEEDERAGRWHGKAKRECGLHQDLRSERESPHHRLRGRMEKP